MVQTNSNELKEIYLTLFGTTTLGKSGPGSNGTEEILHALQNWNHTIIYNLESYSEPFVLRGKTYDSIEVEWLFGFMAYPP